MRMCLACRQKARQRKGGACPNCGVEVQIYGDYFLPTDEEFPGTALIKEFVRIVRERDNLPTFSINRKVPTYNTEVRAAITLLENTGWDLQRAVEVMHEILFHKDSAWKRYNSLTRMVNSEDFPKAVARVAVREVYKENTAQRMKDFIETLEQQEDVFGYD